MKIMNTGRASNTGLPENRKTPQDATDRRKTPTHMNSYVLWHVLYVNVRIKAKFMLNAWLHVRVINFRIIIIIIIIIRKIQHKYRNKIPTTTMSKSVIRRKTPQGVTNCRKTVTSQNA